LYHSDALGNVSTLINSSGTVKAQYTYDPFGYTTSQSGAWASANPYRFSSKEIDYKYFAGGDNYYYGYRFYHPVLHRWLNRDPIGINGGINLYGFVGNNPVGLVDTDGRFAFLAAAGVAYLAFEFGSTIYDIYSASDVVLDPNVSDLDKVKEVGVLAMGVALPGPGQWYKKGAKKVGDKVGDLVGSSCPAPNSGQNIVYRALNAADSEALAAGRGLTARAPNGTWTAAEHVANQPLTSGTLGGAARNSPWLSTSRRLDVAGAYDSGHGVIAIDLNKVGSFQTEVWRQAPRVNGVQGLPYHRSFWAEEVTIFQDIPASAILGPVK
jgi:RHS repeat-associated protein